MALIDQKTLLLLAVFLAAISPISRARLFKYFSNETSETCILVDVDFTIDLSALRGGKTIADARVSSNDEGITITGSCGGYASVLDLVFPNGVSWALLFKEDDDQQVSMSKYVQFIPEKVFGEAVREKDYHTMDDPFIADLGNATESYECPIFESVDYEVATVTPSKVNFTVVVNISHLHAQGFNVARGKFSASHLCAGALTTTSSSPSNVTTTISPTTSNVSTTFETTQKPENTTTSHNMTTESTQATTSEIPENTTTSQNMTTETTQPSTSQKPSPEPTPTGGPKPPVQSYTVKEGNNVCIAMEAAIMLDIIYPVEGNEKTKTAKIFVPKDSKGSGNCTLSASSQDLVISFLENWKLNFTFTKVKTNLLRSTSNDEKEKHPRYKISQIQLTGSVDKTLFPDTTWPAGEKFGFKSEKLNFPEMSSSKDYYQCSSSLTTPLGPNADVMSQDLKFKAFNKNTNADFKGQAAVCAADSGSSRKKTFIIVGCVLGIIVLVAFIVFVVMRVMRRRRDQYQSL